MNAPTPGSPEWSAKVTASKVAAILGLSPWDSPYSMWRKMRQDIEWEDGKNQQAKSRGHYLETGVINWWHDQHPEIAMLEGQRYATREGWAAATPDAYASTSNGVIVMDAKTAAKDDDWGDEPPAYYLVQSLWQMWVCSADVAYIAVLFGSPGLSFREYRIERDDELIEGIVERCRAFYDSLKHEDAPDLDDSVATYEAVRALHPDIDRDATALIDDNLAAEYVAASLAYREAETRDRAARTRLLGQMGRARIAVHDGATLARRQPNRSGVSLVRVATTIPTRMEIPA